MPDLIIRGAAQDNIHNYYDRGNEFYRLWLDKALAYSCTYTSEPEASLKAAQIATMDLQC